MSDTKAKSIKSLKSLAAANYILGTLTTSALNSLQDASNNFPSVASFMIFIGTAMLFIATGYVFF